MGQDGQVRKGLDRVSAPRHPDWDAERELAADRRFERRLLVKEAVVILAILALVLVRTVL